MGYPASLPVIGALAIGGVLVGLQLGQASISEIDPGIFTQPPTRFHADLVPHGSIDGTGYVAQVAPPGTGGYPSSCIGCRTYPEEYYPQPDPAIEALAAPARETRVEETVQLAGPTAEDQAAAEQRLADLDRLKRYARFAVTPEEGGEEGGEEVAAAPADAAPAPAAAELLTR